MTTDGIEEEKIEIPWIYKRFTNLIKKKKDLKKRKQEIEDSLTLLQQKEKDKLLTMNKILYNRSKEMIALQAQIER